MGRLLVVQLGRSANLPFLIRLLGIWGEDRKRVPCRARGTRDPVVGKALLVPYRGSGSSAARKTSQTEIGMHCQTEQSIVYIYV